MVCRALLFLLISSSLLAATDTQGVHSHEGFYFKLGGRLGMAKVEQERSLQPFVSSTTENKASFDGLASGLSFDLGAALFQNFILFATAHYVFMASPSITVGDQTSSTTDFTVDTVNLGGGVCYYLMPANVFVSGSLNIAYNLFVTNGSNYYSNPGFGTTISVGKEWWVSDEWGIGLAAWVHYSRASGLNRPSGEVATSDEVKFKSIAFGAGVTATYN